MLSTEMETRNKDAAALTGAYFDIQRYSIHDGPGIRTTVFLQGCPLSCPWCHNPESRAEVGTIRFLSSRCVRCGACLEVCPAPRPGGDPAPDPAGCIRCGRCVEVCHSGARQVVGRSATVADLVRQVERDRPFYEESGGGVTFSGGEPLLQSEFLAACLQTLKLQGTHTAVDTSGYAPPEEMLKVAAWTDLFLYDLKFVDSSRHLKHTGVPVEPILENLNALDALGKTIWLRLPLIPGINDDAENLDAIGRFAAALKSARRLHLLPYHEFGAEKYRSLGRAYAMGELRAPSTEALDAAARRLGSHGLEVHLGG